MLLKRFFDSRKQVFIGIVFLVEKKLCLLYFIKIIKPQQINIVLHIVKTVLNINLHNKNEKTLNPSNHEKILLFTVLMLMTIGTKARDKANHNSSRSNKTP